LQQWYIPSPPPSRPPPPKKRKKRKENSCRGLDPEKKNPAGKVDIKIKKILQAEKFPPLTPFPPISFVMFRP